MDDLAELFPKVWETSEGFRTLCPMCGDTKGKLYFNTTKRQGCCFEADCPWFYRRGGTNEHRIRALLRGKVLDTPTQFIEQAETAEVKLPKEFCPLRDLANPLRDTLYAYLDSRGIVKKLVDFMKVGYCKEGRYWGYIIFPILNPDGEIVYWQGRRFKKREPKFYNPKASYKTELLYVVGRSFKGHYRNRLLVIVESIINALTIGWPNSRNVVVALLGSSMSDSQLYQILSSKIREIVVALDGDMWKEAVAIADKLAGGGRVIRIAKFPFDEDINALGRGSSWSIIEDAGVYRDGELMSVALSDIQNSPWERHGNLTYDPTVL